jgi:hypothetical protein
MKIGTKVKAKGKHGMEYGIIVPTPAHITWSEETCLTRWDTKDEDDYEGVLGATFLEVADQKHEFKYINNDGTLKNK